MIVELIEETKHTSGTMYAVFTDGLCMKWFAKKEEAQKFYDEIIANPDVLKPVKNILQSQEIILPLDK